MKTLLLDATALGPAAGMNLSIRCIVPILPRRSSDQLTEGSQPQLAHFSSAVLVTRSKSGQCGEGPGVRLPPAG
jgi:hypothetical protein